MKVVVVLCIGVRNVRIIVAIAIWAFMSGRSIR